MTEKKDVLLVNCPPWDVNSPPLTLGYLESYIENQGFETDVIDFNIILFSRHKEYQYLWDMNLKNLWREEKNFAKIEEYFKEDIEWVAEKIAHSSADIIAFSISDPRQAMSIAVMRRVKALNPKKKIIVGGPYYLSINEPSDEEKKLIDLFVTGQGEEVISSILRNSRNKKPVAKIPGTKYYAKGKEIINPAKYIQQDLKNYSYPKYRHFDMSLYLTRSIACEWSRGCIGRCTFCQNTVYIKNYMYRKAENIFEEIKYNVENNNVNHISLADATMNGNLKELEKLCDLIVENNVKINWSGLAIPRKDMSLELLKKMKAAGCTRLEYGLESGSDKVLKLMNKLHTTKEAEEVLERTKKAGIAPVGFIMVGHPGETEEDFEETLRFLKKNRKNISLVRSVNAPYLMVGTELMTNPGKFNLIIPTGPKADYQWYTKDGNTTKLRDMRVKKTIEFLKKTGIPTELHSLNENKDLEVEKREQKKTMNVVLAICPPWDITMPPLGLGYLAEAVRDAGFKPEVIDLNIEIYSEASNEEKALWQVANMYKWDLQNIHREIFGKSRNTLKRFFRTVKRENPLLICFSVNVGNYNPTLDIIKETKKLFPQQKIAVGGPNIDHEYFFRSEMKDYVDFGVIGEGEKILPILLEKIRAGEQVKDNEGIIIPSKKQETKDIFRPVIENLDKIRFPRFQDFPLKKYTSRTIPIIGSRGCIRKCSFCSDYLMTHKYRSRTAENIFEEITYHFKKNKAKDFEFKDLIINGSIRELEKLCDMIIRSGMKINLSSQGMIRKEMSLPLLKKMKAAGFSHITYGVESFSDETLKRMRKATDVRTIRAVLENTKKAGINALINLIIGFPGETKKEFEETARFIEKNHQLIAGISSLNPLAIYGNSDVQLNPDRYGIVHPKDISFSKWLDLGGCLFWKDQNGMDFEERMKRMEKITSILKKHNISFMPYDPKSAMAIIEKDIILLVNPPPWGVEDPPTGLAHITTYLKKKGMRVKCYDANIKFFNSSPPDIRKLWHVENKNFWKNEKTFSQLLKIFSKTMDLIIEEIIRDGCSIIALNVVDPKERITIEIIKRIKKVKPKTKILLGGPGTCSEEVRAWFRNTIPEMIDGYIIGEGEETLYEAAKAIFEEKSIDNIPGMITYAEKSTYKPRKLLPITREDIWPTYEEFNLKEYHTKTIRVEWSRGCISSCVFCKGKALNPSYRFRNPESIVKELEYHYRKNKIKKFIVIDLTVNGDVKKLEKVCDLIIGKKLSIEWLAEGIPRKEMTYGLLEKMRKAGCDELQLGLESGSDKVLKAMKKRHTAAEAQKCIRDAAKAGIRVGLFIMVGFPGETEKDFEKTMQFIRENKKSIAYIKSINAVHLIEGTDLQDGFRKFGINSKDSDDWYYQWKAGKNTWDVRKNRMTKMYSLLEELKIPLVETNYEEGKEKSDSSMMQIINDVCDNNRNASQGNPLKLFAECYKEHGLIYTIRHTIQYIKEAL